VEQTLVLVKPGAVRRKFVGEIISRFETKGFNIVAMRMLTMTPEMVDEHYKEHVEKYFFPRLKEYTLSGPLVAIVLESENVAEIVRNMLGCADATKAKPGTLRGDFSCQSGPDNAVHASDCVVSAKREIELFFG
jgi:nucleoside-diphosphate kinase